MQRVHDLRHPGSHAAPESTVTSRSLRVPVMAVLAGALLGCGGTSGLHTAAELESSPEGQLIYPGSRLMSGPIRHDEGEVGAYVKRYFVVASDPTRVLSWFEAQLRGIGFTTATPTHLSGGGPGGGVGGIGNTDMSATKGDVVARVEILDFPPDAQHEIEFLYVVGEPPRGV